MNRRHIKITYLLTAPEPARGEFNGVLGMMRWSVVLLKDKCITCNMLDRWQHLLREQDIPVILAIPIFNRAMETIMDICNLRLNHRFLDFKVSQGKMCTLNRWGGKLNHPLMAYLLNNYVYQKLMESNNYCWNYRWWLDGYPFLRCSV